MNESNLGEKITQKSFAIIDSEIGKHSFSPAEYAIVRRVIHSTADFEFVQTIRFSPDAIQGAIAAIKNQVPIITDVGMVKKGVATQVSRTFNNPLISALDRATVALPGKTRTETGMLAVAQEYPQGIFAIGNAPTALIALCSMIQTGVISPTLVIGVPVGFVSVVESKAMLGTTQVPQIRVEGRKGGSPVAAAIVNALLILAKENP